MILQKLKQIKDFILENIKEIKNYEPQYSLIPIYEENMCIEIDIGLSKIKDLAIAQKYLIENHDIWCVEILYNDRSIPSLFVGYYTHKQIAEKITNSINTFLEYHNQKSFILE